MSDDPGAARKDADESFPDRVVGEVKRICPGLFTVKIVDVRGLYKPGARDSLPRPPGATRASGYEHGYTSRDDKGRIFTNQDLDGRWTQDTQLIELTVVVTVVAGALPEDATIRWTMSDPDDPFNERPEVHPAWGPVLDGDDYDKAGHYRSPHANDNEGNYDHHPKWEEVKGYALAIDSAARTRIVALKSKVRLHCTNIAGDNYVVHAALDVGTLLSGAIDQTGIMTVWHRVDVEYVRMESAFALPVDRIAKHYRPAFVQLDFAAERVVPDERYMGPADPPIQGASGAGTTAFVARTFQHAGEPPWFFLAAAMECYPVVVHRGAILWEGDVDVVVSGGHTYCSVPGQHTDPAPGYVVISWDDKKHKTGFLVDQFAYYPPDPVSPGQTAPARAEGETAVWLLPQDLYPDIKANQLPSFAEKSKFLASPKQYGIPSRAHVRVKGTGASAVAGYSIPVQVGKESYLAGRAVTFTHHPAYRDPVTGQKTAKFADGVVRTAVHEFTHAFGFYDKCAQFDYLNQSPRMTCCMNYQENWMMDQKHHLIPDTNYRVGMDRCGYHLKEIRRTHLEDNPGLGWGKR
jgi:hypothetical protein